MIVCARRSSYGWAFGQGFDSPRLHQKEGTTFVVPFFLGSTLYWSPMGEESLIHEAVVRFSADLSDGSQRHSTIYLTSEPTEGPGAIYTARLVANGLVLEHIEETGGLIKIAE